MLPTIDELCKNPEWGGKITSVLKECKQLRSAHRFLRNGYVYGREKNLRRIGDIPVSLYVNPNSPFRKWFDTSEMDAHEIKKHIQAFLNRYPEFRVVDKI